VDSGCTHHMCNTEEEMLTVEECKTRKTVTLGNSTKAKVTKEGSVDLLVRASGGIEQVLSLRNVLLVPALRKSLLSVTCLMNDGYNIEFNASEGTCLITRQNLVIGNAKLSGNLWVLDTVQTEDSPESPEDEGAFLTSSEKTLALWHLRFNHLNEDELRRMARSQAVKGLDISDLNGDPVKGRCEGCARGKQHRHPFPSSEKKDRAPLELIHSDLVGPLVETVQTKKKYILTFIDDCTRRSWVYLLGKKSETFQCFKQFQKQVERQSGHKIKILRSDGGGEYIDKDFLDYLTDQGIVKEFSMAYTPQQDGTAERFNRTMVEAALSMLHGAGISTGFWGEAILAFNHVSNRVPTKGLPGGITPYEAWTGVKPSVYHLRPFGCKVSVHIPSHQRKKLDPKSWKGVFMGYSLDKKGYRIWDMSRHQIRESRDVIFYEDVIVNENLIRPGSHPEGSPARMADIFEREPERTQSNEESDSAPPPGEDGVTLEFEDQNLSSKERNPDIITSEFTDSNGDRNGHPISQSGNTPLGQRGTVGQLPLMPNRVDMVSETQEGTDTQTLKSSSPHQDLQLSNIEEGVEPEIEEHVDSAEDPPESVVIGDSRNEDQLSRIESDPVPEEHDRVPELRRSTRVRVKPSTLIYRALGIPEIVPRDSELNLADFTDSETMEIKSENAFCNFAVNIEPQDYQEAMQTPDREKWKEAFQKELDSLKRHNTYSLVQLPKGRKSVKSKWVLKIKELPDGSVKYKARLVAKGFSQKEGIDYTETFAPVIKYKSLRILLAIANERNMEVHQLDVTTAFLYGDLDEEIFMEPPEGARSPDQKGTVWKLNKSLYGLKQSPRCWNRKIHTFFEKEGFSRSLTDYATYTKGSGSTQVILALYVDDMLILSESLEEVNRVKGALKQTFDMTDFGEVSTVLGMRIQRNRELGILTVDQEKYTERILEKFGMENCKPVSLPMAVGQQLKESQGAFTELEKRSMETVPYRSAIGSLMYLMVSTRPDLAAPIGVLSRFFQNPGRAHWEAVKRVLRYVQGTKSQALTFRRTGTLEILGFCDADFAGDLKERKSTTGYIFLLGSGAIVWSSKLQKSVAQSTCEAEYYAAALAGMEAAWLRSLMEELGMRAEEPITIGCDAQATLKLLKNPVYHERTKHIATKVHYVRQQIEEGIVNFVYIPTEVQVADALTKPVPSSKLEFCRIKMGLEKLQIPEVQKTPELDDYSSPEEEEDLC